MVCVTALLNAVSVRSCESLVSWVLPPCRQVVWFARWNGVFSASGLVINRRDDGRLAKRAECKISPDHNVHLPWAVQ